MNSPYFSLHNENKMKNPCQKSQPRVEISRKNQLSEIISWRLLKKNPSGAMIWAVLGASAIVDMYYYIHFLRRKEYQVIQ